MASYFLTLEYKKNDLYLLLYYVIVQQQGNKTLQKQLNKKPPTK